MAAVHVLKKKGRKFLVLRYRDPDTGHEVERSSKTARRSEADKLAGKWEREIESEGHAYGRSMSWAAFRELWESMREPSVRETTATTYAATWNLFATLGKPKTVKDLDTAHIDRFVLGLKKADRTPATIARHLRTLKAIARWAHGRDLLAKLPRFDMPSTKATAKARGRALTPAEFGDLLDAVPQVIRRDAVQDWRFLLEGLWWSGLRLSEALALRWDHRREGVSLCLRGREDSTIRFDAESQKSGREQSVPLAFEAFDFLAGAKRKSEFVFPLPNYSRRQDAASSRISDIGGKAKIITDAKSVRTATAHDLRRSFGYRWAERVMPADLQALMRHASIQTTMSYYAVAEAEVRASSINRRAIAAASA